MSSPSGSPSTEKLERFFADNPQIEFIDVACADMGGVWRGKRLQRHDLKKLIGGGVKFPLTVITCDLWGEENLATGLARAGDIDGVCTPVDAIPLVDPRTPQRAFAQVSLFQQDGSAFYGDCRQVLGRALERLHARGLDAVIATELEFYLLKPESLEEGQPLTPFGDDSSMYRMDDLEDVDAFLNDLHASCRAADVPADTTLAEYGPAQYEINLTHRADALQAADDAMRLKWLVRKTAARHGFLASFLPKLWLERSGCGMHAHVSLIDRASNANVFDDGGDAGTPLLKHAIAGLLALLPESTLCFAPGRTSYRRLRDKYFLSPTTLSWGYDSRFPSIRVPSGPPAARRLEHRVAGADANPYASLAAILAGVAHGLETGADPGSPLSSFEEVNDPALPRIPTEWERAIDLFEKSEILAAALSPEFVKYFAGQKRSEKLKFDQRIDAFEFRSSVEAL